MTKQEAIEQLEQIKSQFDMSIGYAEIGDKDAIEALEDNKEAVRALDMAIQALQEQEQMERE